MKLNDALRVVCISDPGRVRNHNEDSTAVDVELGLAILADGMGGYRAGEVASAVAVTTTFRQTRDKLAALVPGQTDEETGLAYESLTVRDAIAQANEDVYDSATEKKEFKGMGTTLVAALFYDNRLTCAHVGDSRMYAFRGGQMVQLTVDHTVVQEFVQTGLYSVDEAKASFNPSLVTRALGVEQDIDVDVHERSVKKGDRYLLCSDGLTDMVGEDKIEKELAKSQPIEESAQRLLQLANKRGGEDNISIILVEVIGDFKAEENWQTQMLDWFNR